MRHIDKSSVCTATVITLTGAGGGLASGNCTWNRKGLTASPQRFNYDYNEDELKEIGGRVQKIARDRRLFANLRLHKVNSRRSRKLTVP